MYSYEAARRPGQRNVRMGGGRSGGSYVRNGFKGPPRRPPAHGLSSDGSKNVQRALLSLLTLSLFLGGFFFVAAPASGAATSSGLTPSTASFSVYINSTDSLTFTP